MRIEIWALVVLVAVLAVYLLPLLVGRREVMGLSRAQDRYSGNLRVLATGASAPSVDEACADGVHAEIFKNRPEVRAMNRPAVRNVRALRTERELVRARRAHEQGRENRRVAASRRAIVALSLLAVLLGVVVASVVTALPWWSALAPAVLLGTSMLVGRQAAVSSAEADRRERRRISRLESELSRLTTTPVSVEPAGEAPEQAASEPLREAQDRAGDGEPHDGLRAGGRSHTAVRRDEGARDEGGRDEQEVEAARQAQDVTVPGMTVGAWARAVLPASAPQVSAASDVVEEPTTATPPQGWSPVKVPAPTYTLVTSGPRRVIDNLEEDSQPSAPVPVRPVSARTYPALEEETELAAPIDLDAVLERRRAAGA